MGMYTGAYYNSNDFCSKFIQKVEPMLKAELENTNVICNDENFNIGL